MGELVIFWRLFSKVRENLFLSLNGRVCQPLQIFESFLFFFFFCREKFSGWLRSEDNDPGQFSLGVGGSQPMISSLFEGQTHANYTWCFITHLLLCKCVWESFLFISLSKCKYFARSMISLRRILSTHDINQSVYKFSKKISFFCSLCWNVAIIFNHDFLSLYVGLWIHDNLRSKSRKLAPSGVKMKVLRVKKSIYIVCCSKNVFLVRPRSY